VLQRTYQFRKELIQWFGIFIIASTWDLLKDSVNLALDAVPEAIDVSDVQAYLSSMPGVTGVHDLHIWGMSTTEAALTVHLVIPTAASVQDALLGKMCEDLHDKFGIEHATVQIEGGDAVYPCRLASSHVV
jgi:cobalt-zinc-cadmium efflux system protein